jgi:hypothetical protein
MNDQKWFCPSNGSSCYFYNSTSAAYSVHRSACQSLGGYLVAFNTGRLPADPTVCSAIACVAFSTFARRCHAVLPMQPRSSWLWRATTALSAAATASTTSGWRRSATNGTGTTAPALAMGSPATPTPTRTGGSYRRLDNVGELCTMPCLRVSCVHSTCCRRYDFLQQVADNPLWTCIIAYDSYSYDQARGKASLAAECCPCDAAEACQPADVAPYSVGWRAW